MADPEVNRLYGQDCGYSSLQLASTASIQIHHIPGHTDPSRCDNPVDEWLALWNGQADYAAGLARLQLPPAFGRSWENFLNEKQKTEDQFGIMLRFQLALAEGFSHFHKNAHHNRRANDDEIEEPLEIPRLSSPLCWPSRPPSEWELLINSFWTQFCLRPS